MDMVTRKVIILLSLLIIMKPAPGYGQKSMSALEQFEAVSHEHKGCPENSDCDAEMGRLLEQWKKLAQRWLATDRGLTHFAKELILVTTKRGWPAEFYARPAVRSTLAPALFDSNCHQHRSKNPAETLQRGIAFIKGIDQGHVLFTKGETEYRLKLGEAVFLQPVVWHRTNGTPLTFYLPLDERPLYVAAESMTTLVESEGLYALLTLKSQGPWIFSVAPEEGLLKYHEAQEELPCPSNALPIPIGFHKTFCKKITDRQGGAAGTVQLFWACQ